jgi:hypothetical protein
VSEWRKSSRSADNGQCVEARSHQANMQLRDSKLGEASPIFSIPAADFGSLIDGLKQP